MTHSPPDLTTAPSCTIRPRLALLLPLLLAGCGYSQSKMAHQAQYNMIGMTANDLEACAGPPDKTTRLNARTELLTYINKPSATGGLTVQLPLSLGGVSLGGSGTYCSASLRLVDGRVSELHYTGDDDMAVGTDGVCAALVRGCMRQTEPTMHPATGPSKTPTASAFHSPDVPAQPPVAELIEPAAPAK